MKLLLALAVLPVSAQIARVDVGGAPNPMVVGQSVNLGAVARDAAGNVIAAPNLTWTSSNTNVFQVAAPGTLKAVGLGSATITVASGNVRGNMNLSTVPQRVEIDPPAASLFVGDKQQFTVRVLDINRQPITASVNWLVLLPDGSSRTAAINVDASGMLAAGIEGRFDVQATVAGVKAFAPLTIRTRPGYRLSRVFSNDPIPGPQKFIFPAGNTVFGDFGQLALIAHLNGWAQEAFLWDGGQFTPLVASGETDWGFNSLRPSLSVGGITSHGEVLLSSGSALILASHDDLVDVLPQNVYLGTATNFGGFSVSNHAINEFHEIAFYANRFQPAGTTTVLFGIFKVRGNRLSVLWTSDQTLEGLTAPYSLNTPLVDGTGMVYFRATRVGDPAAAIYRTDGSSAPQKILGLGDSVDGSTVNSMNNPVVNESGDWAIVYNTADGKTRLLRQRPGGSRERYILTPTGQLIAVDGNGRVLLRRTQNPQPGLYVWENDAQRLLLPQSGAAPDGGTITSFDVAGFDAAGQVVAQARSSKGGLSLVRPGGVTLLQSGDQVDAAVAPFLATDSLVRGSAFRLKSGASGSLVEPGPSGLAPVITIGDTLPGNLIFNGANRYVDTGAQGIYFLTGPRLFRRVNGAYELMATATAGNFNNFAVNFQGQAVLDNSPRLYKYDGGKLTLIADQSTPAPGGGLFVSWPQVAIDERGRILALANTTTGSGFAALFLYDGAWHRLATINETQIQGTVIGNINSIKAMGDKLYALLNGRAGEGFIVSWRDDGWQVEMGFGDAIPAASDPLVGIQYFDVNQSGDILARVNAPAGVFVLFKSGATVKMVYDYTAAAAGSYLNVVNLILQDDGTAYLAGFDQDSRYIIVRADSL